MVKKKNGKFITLFANNYSGDGFFNPAKDYCDARAIGAKT